MDEHVNGQLPFYVNATLHLAQREAVEAHLAGCAQCRMALREWEELAGMVRSVAHQQAQAGPASSLPALSPVVRANLRRKPSFPEALLASASLIAAQRIYLRESWLIQTLSAALLAGLLAGLFLPAQNTLQSAVPFFILVPLFAVLVISLLESRVDGLGDEILAATPTHPGVLTFARLALALGVTTGLALVGSLLMAGFGRFSLAWLVATWLGPMLWLAALATLLSLLWSPWTAAGISAILWGGVALLLLTEEYGRPLLGFSLEPLLYPSWWSFGVQVILAAVLWLACWLWLFWGAPPALRLDRSG